MWDDWNPPYCSPPYRDPGGVPAALPRGRGGGVRGRGGGALCSSRESAFEAPENFAQSTHSGSRVGFFNAYSLHTLHSR